MVEGAARAPHAPARTCRAHVRPVDRPVSFSTRIKSYICVCQPCIGDKPKNFGITIRPQLHSPRPREHKFVKNQQQLKIRIFLQGNFTGQKKERGKFHRISRNDNRQPCRSRQYRRAVPPAGTAPGDTTANSNPLFRHRRIFTPVRQLSGAPPLPEVTVKRTACGAGACRCQSTNASYCVPATETEMPSFLNAHFKTALLQTDKTGKGLRQCGSQAKKAEKMRPGAKMQPDRVQLYYRRSIRSGSTPGLHTSQTGVKKTVFFPKAPVFFTQLPAFIFQALKPLLKSAAARAFLLDHFSVRNERNSVLWHG